ncbi:MAG: dihydrodipicolinate synthase family protein [Armatimonadetes bacterium]|nr:dihydrodipicolinate synthase family protein [Armatimonadota bacterium]
MSVPLGVMPAMVTPFTESGEIDYPSVARLLAFFQAARCAGVVVAGTNGEGPSLAAVEKRDLIREAVALSNGLPILLGIATNALTEARWLAYQAAKFGAAGLLVMPPTYFKVEESAMAAWLESLLDESPIPVLIYNFPKYNGFRISAEIFQRLAQHPQFAGLKDSSGERENLETYRSALGKDHRLFVGDETLLLEALEHGWSGSISGAANVVPQWLAQIVSEWGGPESRASAECKFQLLSEVLSTIRSVPQPQVHKGVLKHWGVIGDAAVRLPLLAANADEELSVISILETQLGIRVGNLGLCKR